jgi:hypothetical protein
MILAIVISALYGFALAIPSMMLMLRLLRAFPMFAKSAGCGFYIAVSFIGFQILLFFLSAGPVEPGAFIMLSMAWFLGLILAGLITFFLFAAPDSD